MAVEVTEQGYGARKNKRNRQDDLAQEEEQTGG